MSAIGRAEIESIWDEKRLGPVTTAAVPKRGSINRCFVVNDRHVIRFRVRHFEDSGFRSEKAAYDLLRAGEVPVPDVVALDDSRRLVPCDFLITTKLPGEPVLDTWESLDSAKRYGVGFHAGRYQALIHQNRFPSFGRLSDAVIGGGFQSWMSYLEEYFQRFARKAGDYALLDSPTEARLSKLLDRFRSLMEHVTIGSLLHSDYHWENILQEDGRVTGIVDFEWALTGDPAFDCRIDDRLEERCPGSVKPFYDGYTSIRPLAEHHALKAEYYHLLLHLEGAVMFADDTEPEKARKEIANLISLLKTLERKL